MSLSHQASLHPRNASVVTTVEQFLPDRVKRRLVSSFMHPHDTVNSFALQLGPCEIVCPNMPPACYTTHSVQLLEGSKRSLEVSYDCAPQMLRLQDTRSAA
jgi:hypothetical protein